MKDKKPIFIVGPQFGIVQGELIREVDDGQFEVSLNFSDGKKELKQLPKNGVYFTEEDAKRKWCSMTYWLNRKKLSEEVEGKTNFLPEHIGELHGVYASGNPLRFGEPKISFALQGNVGGEDYNPQKIIQIIGGIWEDIEMLQDILYVLSYGNEYVKKLIGKYLIIELRSLFPCFTKLSKLDNVYKDNLYLEFKDEVNKLDDELKFRVVRNKISAHRDLNLDLMTTMELWQKITRYNISEYIEIFAEHINKLLKQYPNEAKIYFTMRRIPFKGITDVKPLKGNNYQPFDEKLSKR